MKTCSIDGCDRKMHARTWCGLHYRRWRDNGDPLLVLIPQACRVYTRRPEAERFWEKVDKSGDCWIWTGAISDTGYGSFTIAADPKYVRVIAHRWAYEHMVGPIPEGLFIDHLCRTRACVNPRHLEPVTNAENVRRGAEARRSPTCKRGHPRTPENTLARASGRRDCRVCHRERERARKAALRDDPCGDHSARCEICDERMCREYGPEPATTCAAHRHCQDCDTFAPACRDCADARREDAA